MAPIILQDTAAGSSARISVDRGFNCFEFLANVAGRPVDVLDSEPGFETGNGRPSGNGIPILFPFPNRIRQGRFHWRGCDYQLSESIVPFDNDGNAIHGLCLDRPWRVIEQSATQVVGEFQLSRDAPDRLDSWPADFVLQVGYELSQNTLTGRFRIHNPGPVSLPWGLGTHPYFRLPLGPDSRAADCLIEAPAAQQWVLEHCLPTGQRIEIPATHDLRDGARFGDVRLDHVLTGLLASAECWDGHVTDAAAGVQIRQRSDSCFRELVVYTPPGRDSVCLEPYTCVTDAINLESPELDTGWRVLSPGSEFSCQIEIMAGLVLV